MLTRWPDENRLHCISLVATVLVTCLTTCGPAWAVPVDFQGPAQDLDLTLTASGQAKVTGQFTPSMPVAMQIIGVDFAVGNVTLDVDGFTYSVANNPWIAAVAAKAATLVTNPRSVSVPPVAKVYPAPNTNLTFAGTELTGATGLHLDLLNGASLSYKLADISFPRTRMVQNANYDGNPLNGPTYFPNPTADGVLRFSDVINTLYIEQGGGQPTFASDGVGTGTFEIPAFLHASLTATITVGGFAAPSLDFDLSTPFTLRGRYLVSGTKLDLSGSQSVSLALYNSPLATAVLPPLFAVTTTVDLTGAALNFALNYNLTTQVPEPGSVLLLAIGVAALAPLVLRRARRHAPRRHAI